VVVGEGDVISTTTSPVRCSWARCPVVASSVVEYFEGSRDPADDDLVV